MIDSKLAVFGTQVMVQTQPDHFLDHSAVDPPFDGTWKLDINTIHQTPPAEPEVLLQGGVYECQDYPIQGRADGIDRE